MPNYNHGPHIHEYLHEFKRDVWDHYDIFTVAEAPLVWPEQALKYIAEDGGQNDSMIQFQCECADCLFTDYIPTPFSLRKMKKAFSDWQYKLEGRAWNMLYLENHDHPRIVTRYGSEKFQAESAKTLAVAYLFQKGTPFLYQGQEIGMTNWRPESADMYRDVQTIYTYNHSNLNKPLQVRLEKMWRSSRDGARSPVQWDDSPNAGFTTGTPWFYVNQNYPEINVEKQNADPDSVLNFYRKAIALRKSLPVVKEGIYKEHFHLHPKQYIYSREMEGQKLLIVCAFSEKSQRMKLPKGFDLSTAQCILHNYPKCNSTLLRPYECRVYQW
jgi:oligo-1,6-glucosidase